MTFTCGQQVAKIILILFNIVFLLSGIAVLGTGIWLLVDKNLSQIITLVALDGDSMVLKYAAYVLIGFGSIVFLVSVFGCCGAITGNKCILGLYIGCLTVIFIGQLTGGIMGGVYKGEVDGFLTNALKTTLEPQHYSTNTSSSVLAWNTLQTELKCCGASNYTDYYPLNLSSTVPLSCCNLTNNDPLIPHPVNTKKCEAEAAHGYTGKFMYLHANGCYSAIYMILADNLGLVVGIGVGIAFVQVVGIILACVMCRRKDDYIY